MGGLGRCDSSATLILDDDSDTRPAVCRVDNTRRRLAAHDLPPAVHAPACSASWRRHLAITCQCAAECQWWSRPFTTGTLQQLIRVALSDKAPDVAVPPVTVMVLGNRDAADAAAQVRYNCIMFCVVDGGCGASPSRRTCVRRGTSRGGCGFKNSKASVMRVSKKLFFFAPPCVQCRPSDGCARQVRRWRHGNPTAWWLSVWACRVTGRRRWTARG